MHLSVILVMIPIPKGSKKHVNAALIEGKGEKGTDLNGIKLSSNSILINELCPCRREGVATAGITSTCNGAREDMERSQS